jgi:predicted nucleotidyltransferase component of viral defense system
MPVPPLPPRDLLADLSREAAEREGVLAPLVEKDFYLTRLLWAFGNELGEAVLLKGGTLLSKVDLGFFRMSEDADLVVPGKPSRQRSTNIARTRVVRDALRKIAPSVGVRPRFPGGSLSEHAAHVIWELDYDSEFGREGLQLEVAIRPVLRPPRRVALRRLLRDPLAGDYAGATCWALDADEARAEKVRAAFSREAVRDFYDLDRLLDAGADFTSEPFTDLVNRKLGEVGLKPLREQPAMFALDDKRRRKLDAALKRDLPAVLRRGAPPFDLDAMLARFDRLWHKS